MVPDPRVELGTPASSGQRSTDELVRLVSIGKCFCQSAVVLVCGYTWWAVQDSNL